MNRIIDGAIEEKEIKVGKEIYMRKIIICIIAVIAVSLIGTTTILAANMGSNEAVRITQTTEIPLIKSTDKITVIQEPNKTEAADNEEVEEETETTVTSNTFHKKKKKNLPRVYLFFLLKNTHDCNLRYRYKANDRNKDADSNYDTS